MFFSLLLALAGLQDAPAPLTITVKEVRVAEGPLYLMVQTRDQFMGPQATVTRIVPVDAPGDETVTVELPAGTYALMVWHDLDNDHEFDRTERGMPLDGWAMSIDGPMTGPPSFEGAKFDVGADGAEVAVLMHYPGAAPDITDMQ